MLWKCRVNVLCRDLCHVSLCGVTNMTTQALSHYFHCLGACLICKCNMLWKCRVSVLCRDLCHVSLCGVTNMTRQALSHFIIWGRV